MRPGSVAEFLSRDGRAGFKPRHDLGEQRRAERVERQTLRPRLNRDPFALQNRHDQRRKRSLLSTQRRGEPLGDPEFLRTGDGGDRSRERFKPPGFVKLRLLQRDASQRRFRCCDPLQNRQNTGKHGFVKTGTVDQSLHLRERARRLVMSVMVVVTLASLLMLMPMIVAAFPFMVIMIVATVVMLMIMVVIMPAVVMFLFPVIVVMMPPAAPLFLPGFVLIVGVSRPGVNPEAERLSRAVDVEVKRA